jgi:hypothetical protein
MKPIAATLTALTLALAAAPAAAQTPPPPRRVFGIGTSVGMGYDINSLGKDQTWPLFPTLSVNVALTPRVELELWLPAANLLFARANGPTGWAWVDASARWYVLAPSRGLFVQAGLGVMRGRFNDDPSFTVLRVPARVGWEVSTEGRGGGFQVGLRPWLDVVIPGADVPTGTRFGMVFEVGYNFYYTRGP